MAGPGGSAQRAPEKKRSGGLVWLLIGIVLGVLGMVFLPGVAGPYLPAALRGGGAEVNGVVEAKSTSEDRLLLTVGSDAGATLVTFTKDIAEIDLLVGVGDSVLLSVDEYKPFIEDARIRRVMKRSGWKEPSLPALRPDSATRQDSAARMDSIGRDSVRPSGVDSGTVDSTAAPQRSPGATPPGDSLAESLRSGAAAP
ncbi:MAG: hypothetical protein ACR2GQ_04205 [Gemmatimonadota bacterium]